MPARIGPRKPRRIYLREWREHYDLTQRRLGERLGVSEMTVSRWERDEHKLSTSVMAAIAEALHPLMVPADLYRHPETPSADALLRETPELTGEVLSYIEYLKSRQAS